MKRSCAALFVALVVAAGCRGTGTADPPTGISQAQDGPATPYKLGMFQESGRTFAGLIVGDRLVVDLSRAALNLPPTLQQIVAGWTDETANRLADGDTIRLPPGRQHIDYECELVAVIGKEAHRVPVERALDYVFGYMAMTDVSDREDRLDGRYGSDWLISKSHDTFGPSGPFIVPAAFVGDPQNLRIDYTLNGQTMQDDSTVLMVHTVRDLVSCASSIATLRPGDLIGTGTPGGVGEARTPPVYLQAGDTSVCTIEKIGSLRNPVQMAEPASPAP